MSNSVYTLSLAGVLNTPAEMADALMAHSYAANKSQTAMYGDNVMSLSWLFERYSNDIPRLVDAVRNGYLTYFSRYFDGVDVDVQIDSSSNQSENRLNLGLYITFTYENKSYNVGNILTSLDGRLSEIIRIKNFGITS